MTLINSINADYRWRSNPSINKNSMFTEKKQADLSGGTSFEQPGTSRELWLTAGYGATAENDSSVIPAMDMRVRERVGQLLLNFVPNGLGIGHHAFTSTGVEPVDISGLTADNFKYASPGCVVQLGAFSQHCIPYAMEWDGISKAVGVITAVMSKEVALVTVGAGIVPCHILSTEAEPTVGQEIGIRTGSPFLFATSPDLSLGVYLGYNLMLKTAVGGGGALAWAKILHEPDEQKDYYAIKLTSSLEDLWAKNTWYRGKVTATWQANHTYAKAVETSDDNRIIYGTKYYACKSDYTSPNDNQQATIEADLAVNWQEYALSKVSYEYPVGQMREFECKVSHKSTDLIKPTNAAYWLELETTKAYLYGVRGPIHTVVPQFHSDDVVPVASYSGKYYLIGAFVQAGIPISNTSKYLITGSIGWVKQYGKPTDSVFFPGRAGAFFR